jgi:hypothetical protein
MGEHKTDLYDNPATTRSLESIEYTEKQKNKKLVISVNYAKYISLFS